MRKVIHFSIFSFIFIFSFLIKVKGKSQNLNPQAFPVYRIVMNNHTIGTAFSFNSRFVVTSFHAIYPFLKEGGGNLDLIKLSQQTLKGTVFHFKGQVAPLFRIKRIAALSIIDDLAILETKEELTNHLSFREDPLSVDEDLFVMGYPSRKFVKLKKVGLLHSYFKSMERSFFVEEIEMDPLRGFKGLSGGPVIDQYGKVVGIFKEHFKNLLVFAIMNQERFSSLNKMDESFLISSNVSEKVLLNQAIQFTYDQAKEGRIEAQYALGSFLWNLKGDKKKGDYWLNLAENNPSNIKYHFEERKPLENFLILYASLSEHSYSVFNEESFNLEWGILQLERAAQLGSGRAMVELMEIYWKGRQLVEKNLDQAIDWALEAVGQNYISVLNPLEEGIREGDSKAFIILKAMADQTDKEWVHFKLSEMYLLKGDTLEGLELLKKLAENHYPKAQFKLALIYYNGKILKRDFFKAFEILKPLAEDGNIKAQFILASMYRDGKGVQKDSFKAFKIFQYLAGDGYPEAQLELASMYRVGEGVKQDFIKAFETLQSLAEKGYLKAQLEVALMYFDGEGVKKDIVRALEILQSLAENGYLEAQFKLALMYLSGEGVKQDSVKGFEMLQSLVEDGYLKAQLELALIDNVDERELGDVDERELGDVDEDEFCKNIFSQGF